MKIVFLGGEDVSARIDLAKKFINLGYDVEIIGTQKENIFVKNSIKYKKYSFNREMSVIDDIKAVLALRKIFKNFKHSIVHAFDTKPGIFLPLAALGLNLKVVRTVTGMGRIFTEDGIKYKLFRKIYNTLQKLISKRVDFTVFQNVDDYNYFIKYRLVRKDKCRVVKSSGIDLEKFNAENLDLQKLQKLKDELNLKNGVTFLLVSRMVKQKGILNFLEAAKICREKGYDYNFLLVGPLDTDQSITLEDIKKYSDYVTYLGKREDVRELMAVSDVFVLPTYYREGVPRVLLEASAMGLALIATDMPGCRDVVIDGFNGLLVNIKDSCDLVSKIVRLGEDRKLIKKFGNNAKIKVKEFDLDKIVKEYESIYKGLI